MKRRELAETVSHTDGRCYPQPGKDAKGRDRRRDDRRLRHISRDTVAAPLLLCVGVQIFEEIEARVATRRRPCMTANPCPGKRKPMRADDWSTPKKDAAMRIDQPRRRCACDLSASSRPTVLPGLMPPLPRGSEGTKRLRQTHGKIRQLATRKTTGVREHALDLILELSDVRGAEEKQLGILRGRE